MPTKLRPPLHADEYYREQRLYFERSVKRTMIPVDSPYLQRHVDQALELAGISSGERILEIGCGMGRYTLLLAQRGLEVEGLDLSAVLLERLRAYNRGRFIIPLHCGEIEDPPSGIQGPYDVVLGFFMLHHVHGLERCFAAVHRLLKRGGRAVFVEPNPYNPLYYLQILITPGMTWRGDGGIVRMRPRVVLPALERAGFSRLSLCRFGCFPPPLANRGWGARLESACECLVVPRSMLAFQVFRAEKMDA